MSGGHDDCRYLYADISEAARYVRNDIRREPEETEFGDIRSPNSNVLNMVYESIAAELERASIIYKSYDYCESGDKGEDDVLMDYWNCGYAQTEEIRAAILERLEEFSQDSREYSYDVWVESGKRVGDHSLRLSGGYYMSGLVLTYADEDGIEQRRDYSSWEEYRSEVMSVKAQHKEPQTLYNLVNDKIICSHT